MARRDDLKPADSLGGAGAPAGLHEADHHVLAPVPQRPALAQHSEGLAGAWRGAQVQVHRAPPDRFRQVRQSGTDAVILADDLAAGRVVGVKLAVAAPVHRDVKLPGCLVLAVPGAQDVGEEASRQVAVDAAAQRPVNGAHQRRAVQRRRGEDLFAVLDARAGEDPSAARQRQPLAAEIGEPEQYQCVNERQQVVDLKAQVVGQVGEVSRTVMPAEQDLGEAGQPVHGGLRQRRIAEPAWAAGRLGWGRGRSAVALRHHPVYLVDERLVVRRSPATRPGERVTHVCPDPAGVGAQDEDPVGEQDRFLDVVRDHDDGFGREPAALPEFQQLAAQVLGRQHVQRTERLIHEQRRGLHDQCASEPDPLAHASRQFLGIGGLITVQAHDVDHMQRPTGSLSRRDAARLQADLDVLLHG